jgi:formylglycine-generating enzyme required for sulfatase activity
MTTKNGETTMTTTMKMALGSLAVCLALGAAADTGISDVVVRQRWPWSRLVDIDYVLTCDETQSVDVAVAAYDGSKKLTLPAESLAGDLSDVSHGPHRITWDPTVTSYTNSQLLTQFNVALTYTPVPTDMVVDLTTGETTYQYCGTNLWADVTNAIYKTDKLVLRRISAGTFTMGSPSGETGRNPYVEDRETSHQVTLTKGFYIGVYEVTQKQWQHILGTSPSYFNNADYADTRPVEQVSYNTIRGATNDSLRVDWPATGSTVKPNSFIDVLRSRTGNIRFDLPTDAQWEYACRAGTTTGLNNGSNLTNIFFDANFALLARYKYSNPAVTNVDDGTLPRNCGITNGTTVVGSCLPNAWGLYDMHGNVWEWCLDLYATSLGASSVTDPPGPRNGDAGATLFRVWRGGGWSVQANECRSANRHRNWSLATSKQIGLRLVVNLP